MRKQFLVLIFFTTFASFAWAESLFESRGIFSGRCYREISDLKCKENGQDCVLHLFPNSSGALSLAAAIPAKNLFPMTDFRVLGFAYFQVQTTNTQSTVARVYNFEEISPKGLQQVKRSYIVTPMACPKGIKKP